MLKYGIIGFGGLGKRHFRNTEKLRETVGEIQLTALCDIEESAFLQQTQINNSSDQTDLDLSAYRLYTNVEEMLEKEDLDFVITALPTYLHEPIAVQAMEKGLHVFSEKPMALNGEQAQRMIDTAEKMGVHLMIGQCVRYAPYAEALKEWIATEKYGKVLYANFERFSGPPVWSWKKWMLDEEKSGGAALDLHVHDVDLVQWLFGLPRALTARRVTADTAHDMLTAFYDYPDKYVSVSSGWGLSQTFKFRSEQLVRFEHATLEVRGGVATLYTDEKAEVMDWPARDNYVSEVADFITCIRENRESRINDPRSCKRSMELALAEKKAAAVGETIYLTEGWEKN